MTTEQALHLRAHAFGFRGGALVDRHGVRSRDATERQRERGDTQHGTTLDELHGFLLGGRGV
jgi:hypothetical protein